MNISKNFIKKKKKKHVKLILKIEEIMMKSTKKEREMNKRRKAF